MTDSNLNRRDFLKLSAITGSGVAMSSVPKIAAGKSYTKITASHWGVFHAHVQNGKFVKVTPYERDIQPTAMVNAMPGKVYSETRIKYPMVRESFLKGGHKAGGSRRGLDKYVRVSWEQALDLVASEIKRVQKATGNQSFYTGSAAWYDAAALHNANPLMNRLFKKIGGSVTGLGDYSTGAGQTILPYVTGTMEVYEQQTSWESILANTEIIVLWGADLLKLNQIGWSPAEHYTYGALKRLKRTTIEVVSIDPQNTSTARALNAEWLAVRPHTDIALALGLMHTLQAENLQDQKFLDEYTVGYDIFLDYLTGKKDGQPKDADWAAAITEIPAEKIRELARKLAAKRAMLMGGWSIQRRQHGEHNYWALVTLAAMLGDIGLPGGGFGFSYHYDNGGSLTANAPIMGALGAGAQEGPEWPAAATRAIPHNRLTAALESPGAKLNYKGTVLTYPDIRLIYWCGGNPFHHQQDRNRQVKAWRKKPETVIVQDYYWTASAKMADIVLPACTPFERDDLSQAGGYSQSMIVAMNKIVEPLWESKTDYWIFTQLAKRLGVEEEYTEGFTEGDWLEFFYEDVKAQAAKKGLKVPATLQEFQKVGVVHFPIPETAKDFVRFADYRADPDENPLSTPSGKIEIYSPVIARYKYDDCPPHATWMEPKEWLGGPVAKQYPLHLLSPHSQYRLHSEINNTWFRETYEIGGREPITLNTDDAAARGIKMGDIVRVFNGRGQVLAGAYVTPNIRPGTVALHEGAWYDPDLSDTSGNPICKHGDPNVLTMDIGTSQLAQANCASTALVQVEKYTGVVPPVTAFKNPVK